MKLNMKKVIWMLLFLPFMANAQGIKFEENMSWAQIQAKAKAEHKYIFMDCYATWCGPCKWMNAQIFPQKEVGDFFNSHFVNVAIQMDRTPKDINSVREWYA